MSAVAFGGVATVGAEPAAPRGFPLPEPSQTLLLQALLLSGREARAAWHEWLGRVGDPLSRARRDRSDRLRALLPLLAVVAERGDLAVDDRLLTVARTALVREELRHGNALRLCEEVLTALSATGIQAMAASGALFAERVWPSPGARHSDGPRLVVPASEVAGVAKRLVERGFEPWPPPGRGSWRGGGKAGSRLRHRESGLEFVVAPSLVDAPMESGFDARVTAASELFRTSTAEFRVPSRPHDFFAVCAAAALSGSGASVLWAVDASLAAREMKAADWEEVRRCRELARVPGTLDALFAYLRTQLRLPVPPLAPEPHGVARPLTRSDFEALLARARTGGKATVTDLVRASGPRRSRWKRFLWLAFPTRRFIRRGYGVGNGLGVAAMYLARPFRWLVRSARRSVGAR